MTDETTKPARKPIPRPPTYDPAVIEDLCDAVYRIRLGPGDTASMLRKDGDGGAKLRNRAQSYAPIVKATLQALEGAP